MTEGECVLIGIAGGSCSGKSTLVRALESRFGNDMVCISFDDYFVGTDRLRDVVVTDWESPTLYNYHRFVSDLGTLKSGQTIELECHSRESKALGIKTKLVTPRRLIVIEGFLIFYDSVARAYFDKRIFIDLPEEEIVVRRLKRIQGNEGWDNPDYIQNNLIPGHRKYVVPQMEYADFIVNGLDSAPQLVSQVVRFIEK